MTTRQRTERRASTRALRVAVPLLLAAGAAGWAGTASAETVAPSVTGWWSASSPAPQPDVAAGQLLVQGSTSAPAGPAVPVPGAPAASGVLALAALSFPLPNGASPTVLRLPFAGSAPPATGITACPATAAVKAASNGKLADAPTYDCSKATSVGTVSLDGKALEFSTIGALPHADRLDLVLVPGMADRVVLAKPGADALAVDPARTDGGGSAARSGSSGSAGSSAGGSGSGGAGSTTGSTGAGTGSSGSGTSNGSSSSSSSGGAATGAGAGSAGAGAAAAPGGSRTSAGTGTGSSAAGSGTSGQRAARQPFQPASASGPLSHDALRRALAGVVLLLAVVGLAAAAVVGRGAGGGAGRLTAAALALSGQPVPAGLRQARKRGVGRFARDREGLAPRL